MASDLQYSAMAHPLRRKILEVTAAEAIPAREIAKRLSVSATRLYRHIEQLLEAGLLEVSGEEKTRGLMTRSFRSKSAPAGQAKTSAPDGKSVRVRVPAVALDEMVEAMLKVAQSYERGWGESVEVTVSVSGS